MHIIVLFIIITFYFFKKNLILFDENEINKSKTFQLHNVYIVYTYTYYI